MDRNYCRTEKEMGRRVNQNKSCLLYTSRFCDAGAEGLLYEEIADQIGKLGQCCEARTESETVQQVMILPGRLKDADAAAASVGGLLRLPCRCLRFDIRPAGKSQAAEEDIHFSAMVLCAAHRPEKGLSPVRMCIRDSLLTVLIKRVIVRLEHRYKSTIPNRGGMSDEHQ